MKIHSAEFVIGAAQPGQFPPSVLPEVAFVGKSNVGKSSLINTLLHRKSLVKTSATPGKTQQINFFEINGRFRFVDLPGYGFARAPKPVRDQWEWLIGEYLRDRACLRGTVLIVDARHKPSPLDVQMKGRLAATEFPIILAVNKMDKLNRSGQQSQLKVLRDALATGGDCVGFSAKTGEGRDPLWRLLRPLLDAGGGKSGEGSTL
jgi:GTP-binding protein